jgi:hypothetical protein
VGEVDGAGVVTGALVGAAAEGVLVGAAGGAGGVLAPPPGSAGGSARATPDIERSERTASREAEFRRLMVVVGLPERERRAGEM